MAVLMLLSLVASVIPSAFAISQSDIDALQAKLKEYPVSLYLLVSIFNLTKDPAVIETVAWKAQNLLIIINNSGRGTVDSPLQVICVNDEYLYLGQVERMQGVKSQVLVEEGPLAPLDQIALPRAGDRLEFPALIQGSGQGVQIVPRMHPIAHIGGVRIAGADGDNESLLHGIVPPI